MRSSRRSLFAALGLPGLSAAAAPAQVLDSLVHPAAMAHLVRAIAERW